MVRTMMLRKQSQQTADRRVKQVTEVLQGIRAVKISSWERAVAEAVRTMPNLGPHLHPWTNVGANPILFTPTPTQVRKMRAAELADLRLIRLLRAASTVLFTCAPLLVAMSTIAAFSWLQGRTLTPARIFTALMLVNSLRMPLAFYPMVLNMTAMAFVSLRRIHFFLNEEEVVQKPALPAVTEEGAAEPGMPVPSPSHPKRSVCCAPSPRRRRRRTSLILGSAAGRLDSRPWDWHGVFLCVYRQCMRSSVHASQRRIISEFSSAPRTPYCVSPGLQDTAWEPNARQPLSFRL